MSYLSTSIVRGADPSQRARPLYNIFSIAGLLGQRHRSLPYIRRYFDRLIADRGFPAPLPLLVNGGELASGAHKHSQWLGDAVDAWLAGQAPPPLAPSIDAARLAAAGNRLDANAARLRNMDAPGDTADLEEAA